MQQEPRKNIQRMPGKLILQLKISSICIFYTYCMLYPLIQSWSSIPASSTHRGPAVFTVLILYYFTHFTIWLSSCFDLFPKSLQLTLGLPSWLSWYFLTASSYLLSLQHRQYLLISSALHSS